MIVTLDERGIAISEDDYFALLRKNHNLTLIKNVFESLVNKKSKGKMFNIVTATWNPVTGCLYDCNYCWARELAATKLKNSQRYFKGFKPSLNETEFRTKFSKGDIIFVSDMGDLFGAFVPKEWIRQVLEYISNFSEANFLFMTKNPIRYTELLQYIPKNAILGATIETNIDEIIQTDRISKAPLQSERYTAMKTLDWEKKIVSIEPILDFELQTFAKWVEDIYPFLVYVGYDNYNYKLREPLQSKTLQLIDKISEYTLVIKKSIRSAWFES
jgi:DNA repair photolyase